VVALFAGVDDVVSARRCVWRRNAGTILRAHLIGWAGSEPRLAAGFILINIAITAYGGFIAARRVAAWVAMPIRLDGTRRGTTVSRARVPIVAAFRSIGDTAAPNHSLGVFDKAIPTHRVFCTNGGVRAGTRPSLLHLARRPRATVGTDVVTVIATLTCFHLPVAAHRLGWDALCTVRAGVVQGGAADRSSPLSEVVITSFAYVDDSVPAADLVALAGGADPASPYRTGRGAAVAPIEAVIAVFVIIDKAVAAATCGKGEGSEEGFSRPVPRIERDAAENQGQRHEHSGQQPHMR